MTQCRPGGKFCRAGGIDPPDGQGRKEGVTQWKVEVAGRIQMAAILNRRQCMISRFCVHCRTVLPRDRLSFCLQTLCCVSEYMVWEGER